MILGICGSPRDQTTNYVLNIALSKLKNKKIQMAWNHIIGQERIKKIFQRAILENRIAQLCLGKIYLL